MTGEFDKNKYKKIVRRCNLSQKDIVDKLRNEYDIDFTLGGVKNWTRNSKNRLGEVYQPSIKILNALADMCNCSIQDFFSDAEKKREQIAQEEISEKPQKYSSSFLSTLPKITQEMLENFSLLTEDEQKDVLSHVKQLVYQGKPKV